ncbi:GNAT family N-acetyltransferase [Streptomyces sp. NPDC060194]|uniref:GNAT family N-acetyltransferase n=1 Tax=Streptomyces sp. NPDC060194 TaxID=3347069 RepID=UPI00364EC9A6
MILVRDMRLDDCGAVAEVRVRGWQAAYAGLMPQAYLDAMNVPADAERRRELFRAAAPGVRNLVAERDGTVVGWGCVGPSRDADAPGTELYALYVHPAHWSCGAGHALLTEILALNGDAPLCLWVVTGNTRARRFYERAGFAPDGTSEPFVVDGTPVPELRYARRAAHA